MKALPVYLPLYAALFFLMRNLKVISDWFCSLPGTTRYKKIHYIGTIFHTCDWQINIGIRLPRGIVGAGKRSSCAWSIKVSITVPWPCKAQHRRHNHRWKSTQRHNSDSVQKPVLIRRQPRPQARCQKRAIPDYRGNVCDCNPEIIQTWRRALFSAVNYRKSTPGSQTGQFITASTQP